MSKDQQPRSIPRLLFRRVFAPMLLILVAYVLSIGPMFGKWEQARATGDDTGIIVFYLPLMVACEESPTFRSALNAYIDMWTFA